MTFSEVLKEARYQALEVFVGREFQVSCKGSDGNCSLRRLGTTEKPVCQDSEEWGEQGLGAGHTVGMDYKKLAWTMREMGTRRRFLSKG